MNTTNRDDLKDVDLKAEFQIMSQTMEKMRSDFGRMHPEMATPKDFILMRENFSYVIDFAQVIMANWVQTEIDLEDCTKLLSNMHHTMRMIVQHQIEENRKSQKVKPRKVKPRKANRRKENRSHG